MKQKVLAVFISFLWCLIILLFPIISGTLSVILSLNTAETLFLQGAFMAAALIIPAVFVLKGKRSLKDIGFAKFNFQGCKKALYFIPILVIFIPAAIGGFHIKSTEYFLGSMFLYLFVGISEEVYFRGIIPGILKNEFSERGIVLLSSAVFAVGHSATAFSGGSVFDVLLTVLNAFIFGIMAIEITLIAENIIPAIIIHFLFDFETKIAAISGEELLTAEIVRGALMFVIAVLLAVFIRKHFQKQANL